MFITVNDNCTPPSSIVGETLFPKPKKTTYKISVFRCVSSSMTHKFTHTRTDSLTHGRTHSHTDGRTHSLTLSNLKQLGHLVQLNTSRVTLVLPWDHLESTLGSPWVHLGSTMGPPGVHLGSTHGSAMGPNLPILTGQDRTGQDAELYRIGHSTYLLR
jgi:hypothetical protein